MRARKPSRMSGCIRFGVYELDPDALELHKHGVPVRLQEQPLQVLTALLERPGEIVSREQLQERIWGKDTFVDFDQSLNKAVNRLREALNDDPAHPRFVETVPRRGYRFVAPVTRNGVADLTQASPNTELKAPPRADKRRISPRAIAAGVSLLVLAAIGLGAIWRWGIPSKPIVFQTQHVTSGAFCCPTLSRDGKLLAYSAAIAGGSPHIWVRQTAGGEAFPVTNTPEGDYSPDFDPTGTRLVYWSGREGGVLLLKPTFAGEATLVAKVELVGTEHFSPDGDRIMYPDDKDGLTIVSPDTGERVLLKDAFPVYGAVLWSPKGDKILFYGINSRDSGKPDAWWVASLASREARRIVLPEAGEGDIANQAVMSWIKDENGREWIIYAVLKGFVWKILRIHVSEQGEILDKPEEVSSGTGRLSWGPSPWADGKLVYMTANPTQSIYDIPINKRGDKLGPVFQVPLPKGGNYGSPFASHDGTLMAYYFSKPREMSPVFLRNLSTGTEHLLEKDGGSVSISPDGARVAFARDCKNATWGGAPLRPLASERPCSFVIAASGGAPEQVCKDCNARGFSSNGSLLLVEKYFPRGVPDRIDAIDLATKTGRVFLSSSKNSLYHAFFSWDDRWVVFKKLFDLKKAQILIAPVRNGVAAEEKEWIAVTDGQHSDDKPQFSADGNTILFTSTRDGYLCIWRQRLNPITKHPVGQPFAIEHFHNSEGAYGAMLDNQWYHDLSVAQDKMLINLPEVHADVWMTQIR
jgi:DNA-binding winged helix-turn-helix (wHTH) protein/Tol biopolymer transport system component